MKKPFLLLLFKWLFVTGKLLVFSEVNNVLGQAPQGINYQAVARDVSGNPLANTTVNIRFSIFNTSPLDTVWIETHSKITDQFGLFTAVIGQGTKIGGSATNFSDINWGNGAYSLRVIINGNNMGHTPFFSVPYSLHTRVADSLKGGGWSLTGNANTVDGTNFMGTTDDKPFNIRVNNQKAGRIETDSWNGNNFANTFFGYQSGFSTTTGSYNTASGAAALYSNTTGSFNTASGWTALYSNTTGYYNTASGSNSLLSNTTGSFNTASGAAALYYNRAGSNATAVGYNAMYYANNTTTAFTNYNVAVGYEALRGSPTPSVNTGNYNTALGYQTLLSTTSGGNNTAIGYLAGQTTTAANALTTGSNNTFIGYNTGFASATQRNNATAIGYNAKVDADNAMVLGGTGVDAVNVGIGITAPIHRLDVHHAGTNTASIYGENSSNSSGYGIFGNVTSGTGTVVAVYGITNPTNTYALAGHFVGNVKLQGGVIYQRRQQNGNYIIGHDDYFIEGNPNASITYTLSPISGAPAGKTYIVRNISSTHSINVTVSGGNTICPISGGCGIASISVSSNQVKRFYSDGANTWIEW